MKDKILKILKENWHHSYNDATEEIMDLINKNTHGGKRKGAGRKRSGVETTTIAYRVPLSKKEELHAKVKELLDNELGRV